MKTAIPERGQGGVRSPIKGGVVPELPEVEVVKRGLEQILSDQPRLKKIEFMRENLRTRIPIEKLRLLEGARILGVRRRAKYLIIETEKGDIISHLGMTGTWRVAPLGEERLHDHIYMYLEGGVRLAYRDPRRFGIFEYLPQGVVYEKFESMGPEPLERSFTATYLAEVLSTKDLPIKAAIMDQKVVVGVGNIYACEALFQARISPLKASKKLKASELEALVVEIKKVLRSSIKMGGSSISDFAKADGESGYFQNTFRVYGRAGESCVVCAQQLVSKVVAGRNTFWCKKCQS